MTKNPVKLKESLPLLQISRQHALKFKSNADDEGTAEREAKYTLLKLLNKTSALGEYSLDQCCAGLLKNPYE